MRILGAAFALLLTFVATEAAAHGGGGHYVYVPIYIPGGPALVPPAQAGDYSQIHKIAILTATAQSLMLGQQGWLVDHKTIDISDLKLDDAVDAELRNYLAPRFTIVDVPYDRAALASFPNDKMHNSNKDVAGYLAALKASDIDAFVVVRPDAEGDGPLTPGLSLARSGAQPMIEANFSIDIIDAKTLKILGHALSRVNLRDVGSGSFAAFKAPASIDITPEQTPSDAQRAVIKTQFTRLLAVSVLETLRALNTGVTLPGAGGRTIVPVNPETDPFRDVKSVAVVSTIGDALELYDLEMLGGVSSTRRLPVPDMQINAQVETLVTQSLAKRFDVQDVPADLRKSLHDRGAAAEAQAASVKKAGIDALILIFGFPSSGYSAFEGIGLARKPTLFGKSTAFFVSYVIAIVDTKTGKILAAHRSALPPSFPSDVSISTVDDSLWPVEPAPPAPLVPLTADQSMQIHDLAMKQLEAGIPETMLHMQLTGTRISYGPGTDSDEPAAHEPATPTAAPSAVKDAPPNPQKH